MHIGSIVLTLEPGKMLSPFKKIFILCVWCLGIPHMCLVSMEVRGGHQIHCNRVTYGSEPPFGCWEQNLGLLQEEQVLFTAEPSSQSQDLLRDI